MKAKEKVCQITVILLGLLFLSSEVYAELKLNSVYPDSGVLGQDLKVTLTGTGFDKNTRVSMYLDSGNERAIIGTLDTQDHLTRGVAVIEDMAYMTDGSGLKIIDVSNPQKPVLTGSLDTSRYAGGVAVIDDKAYVTVVGDIWDKINSSLQIIDVSNPSNPIPIGSVDIIARYVYEVTVIGDTAYVAAGDFDKNTGSLQIIDVSNPSNPTIISSADTGDSAYGVTVADSIAYVTIGDIYITSDTLLEQGSLKVIDVSDPSNPVIIGSVDTPNWALGITLVGNTAYVAAGLSGLQVINVRDPSSPTIIGALKTNHFASEVKAVGSTIYVADSQGGLQAIDVSDPSNPMIIGTVDNLSDAVSGLAVIDDKAYVALDDGGLQIIDISNISPFSVIGSVNTPGFANGLTVIGDNAYVADLPVGLQIIDISNPYDPRITGSVNTPVFPLKSISTCFSYGITVSENIAYIGYGNAEDDENCGLQVTDVSNPSDPKIIGSVNTPGYPHEIAVVGNIAYAACWQSGLQVIDISNPSAPQVIASADTQGNACGITVRDNIAYIVCGGYSGNSLQIIDVSDPANPKTVSSAEVDRNQYGTNGITVLGSTAYMAVEAGLQVFDVSDPANPKIIGHADTPNSAVKVSVSGATAYLVHRTGLQVIDVSNSSSPIITGSLTIPGDAYEAVVIGDKVYAADSRGLVILPVPVEIDPVTVDSETSISLTLPSPQIAGRYTLRIFNENENHELPGVVNFIENDARGDINGDTKVDLADAILALKVLTGSTLRSETINWEGEVNGDKLIGLEEAVYIVQKVSEIRYSFRKNQLFFR